MDKPLKTGKVKAIGVYNCSRKYLEELLPQVEITPTFNQIENHPRLPQQEIVDLCNGNDIVVTAYSPLGSTGSPMMQNEHSVKLAKEKGTTPGRILLSYHVARGSAVLAKSVTPSRIVKNLKVVNLSPQDVASLGEISSNGFKRFVYPEFGVNLGFPDMQ